MKREQEALRKLEQKSYSFYNPSPKQPEQAKSDIPAPRILDRDYYSVSWVARHIGSSERHIYRLIDRGFFANCMDISSSSKRSKWQIPRESILAYKKKHSIP